MSIKKSMNSSEFQKVFPLGAHLCREPMPLMSEMKQDMENLKKHGFNLIKLQEQWAIDEPLEGQYDFSKYEELIEYAARLDMGVYLGLTCEQAPAWLWRKYPDCRMVGRNGVPIYYEAQTTLPADGKPGPCFDHPGANEKQIRFIKKLVETLAVYKNIVVWNTWQEVGYWAERLVGQRVCYCENTIDFFREWLKETYGDLDGLNRAWNSRYLEWSYVSPDTQTGEKNCIPHRVDWNYFMENIQIARILRNRTEAIKEADIFKRPVFAHKEAPNIGPGRSWAYARCQDFLGCSIYPAWNPADQWDDHHPKPGMPCDKYASLKDEMWNSVALKLDYIRSANTRGNPIWAAEFQGGPICTGIHKGRVPSADDIRRWMLTAVGSGVTGIVFWAARAEIMALELNGFSLLNSEGDTTARFEEASRIGKALNKHADLFSEPTWQRSEVAILINEWNYQLCTDIEDAAEHLTYSIRGWYRLLWEAGIPVDFLEASELNEAYAKDYKTIILPFPLSLSEHIANKIADYVKHGGNLICEACPGRLTEHAFANRGELSPTMKTLLGVKHKNLRMVREPEHGHRWMPAERTYGEYDDAAMLTGTGAFEKRTLRANLYVETFDCQGSEPILNYGHEVSGTVNKIGKGNAVLLGTFAGHNGTAYRDSETRTFIRHLLTECAVVPEYHGKLLLRKRISEHKEAWIFTNPVEKEVSENIEIRGFHNVEDLLEGPVDITDGWITIAVQSLDVRVFILGKTKK